MSKSLPILFNGQMVRAILENRKTVTRRLVKPQPERAAYLDEPGEEVFIHHRCPYGGELYVRETWVPVRTNMENWGQVYPGPAADCWDAENDCLHWGMEVRYAADGGGPLLPETYNDGSRPRWRPSIHMPKWAARIFLTVTSVRIERVQTLSEADALAEGCTHTGLGPLISADEIESAREQFVRVWDDIYEKNGLGWDANPWVWVIDFKRQEKPDGP